MYLLNKYTTWYYNIINNAKNRTSIEHTDKHHIIPRSLGGSNDKDNLVSLTRREHFICHLLLVKMTEGKDKSKMSQAAFYMRNVRKSRINARTYELLRASANAYQRQLKTGGRHSEETKTKISKTQTGKPSNYTGKNHTSATKNKISVGRGHRNPIGNKRWVVNKDGLSFRSDTIPDGFKLGRTYK